MSDDNLRDLVACYLPKQQLLSESLRVPFRFSGKTYQKWSVELSLIQVRRPKIQGPLNQSSRFKVNNFPCL